ncbi:4-carboxy-2-hydroxymuconate-6-semialdehyde dehydrogenase [gamma proteobacterium NOR5-3]|nr:4-carboxy-2-hydroxymuconate-6-semialdehyde dehydrogenase [gamma proteobacterium NOR5-3]
MKICLAGEGAFGNKHLDALSKIAGIEVVSLVGGVKEATCKLAQERGIAHWTLDLEEGLAQPGVEAAILATPTPLHASQAMQVLRAGKHVLVEIPMSESLTDAEALARLQAETGLVAMAGHVRRFNPSHQWIRQRIRSGAISIQQMDVQTYFFRRSNLNALGQPRSWTDHLLWHHACHTVDLFMYQTGEPVEECYAVQGPVHEELGIAMDMGIVMKSSSGSICTLSLSFNNDGPLGTSFRYICDNGTYQARYDDLYDGNNEQIDVSSVDVSMNGVELIDREFFTAIREGREPNGSIAQCLPAMRVLDRLERQLSS